MYNVIEMTAFEKAHWNVGASNIALSLPISKIDKERRIVSGWATTDQIDKQGDIIPIDASKEAFEEFVGNVREQHDSALAVGKVVSFRTDKVFDKKTGEVKNGIFVDVYISKGAENTWLKINEGVLRGFSIGGAIIDAEQAFDKSGTPVRIINKYRMSELSVVDNPANDLAEFVSIQKFGDIEKNGNVLENVYWCAGSETVIVSSQDSYDCPKCDKTMTNIGFVESNDVNKSEAIQSLVDSVSKVSEESDMTEAIDKSIANSKEKEGNIVGFLNRKTTVVEEFVAPEVAKADEPVVEEVVEKSAEAPVEETLEKADEEVAEEAAEATEVADEEAAEEVVEEEAVEKATAPEGSDEDLSKADDTREEIMGAISELASVVKSLSDQLAEVKKSLSEEVSTVKGEVTKIADRVDSVEADTAVRKSGDLGGIVQERAIQKSKWGGRFLNTADL